MNELVKLIVSNVGVNQGQAEGGLGAILNFASENISKEKFSKISDVLGDADSLMNKFNQAEKGSGFGSLLGSVTSALGVGGNLGSLASIASGLSQFDLDLDTLKKFIPVISEFLESKGHGDVAGLIKKFI